MFAIMHRRATSGVSANMDEAVVELSAAAPSSVPDPETVGKPDNSVQQEVARHVPLLKVLGAQIAQTAQQVEHAVVGVCANFQQIAERARNGVNRAAAFLSGRDGHSSKSSGVEELILQSRANFDSLLASLEKSAEISNQAVQRMKEIDGYAEKILGSLKQLENISNGNRILALNARIEAAHAGEFGKGFEIVATEVVAQADRSHSVINGVSRTIQELRTSAASALESLVEMSEQGQRSAAEERRQVEQTLESFNVLDHEMRAMLEQTSQDGGRLSDEIGRAVHQMQFQDRVNQRLGHVVEALGASCERLEGLCEPSETPDESFMNEILERYTMHEERTAAHQEMTEAAAGDVELF